MKKIDGVMAQLAGKVGLVMAISLSLPAYADTASVSIQPLAEKLMRQMSDFLGKQQSFSVSTENSLEVVLENGQKIQYTAPTRLELKRPNLLRASRKGDLVDQEFYYDGKAITLFSRANGFYATTPAPATIDQTLDMARDKLDIIAPGGDFIYTNSYAVLMQDVESGFYVGKAVVGGVICDHLAFRGKDVDWQIWIAEGSKPLPKKYVITSKRVAGEPQFTVFINEWNLAAKFSNTNFSFKPPKNANRIEFLRLTTDAESANR